MNEPHSKVPHFLRVARALARVSVALPLATVATSVVVGTSTGCDDGTAVCREDCGAGGSYTDVGSVVMTGTGTTSTSSSSGGGYDGGPVGDMVMPDSGELGLVAMPDAGEDGGELGLVAMPDAGEDAGT